MGVLCVCVYVYFVNECVDECTCFSHLCMHVMHDVIGVRDVACIPSTQLHVSLCRHDRMHTSDLYGGINPDRVSVWRP